MPRTVRDENLASRNARLGLAVRRKPYFRALSEGLHLGYRRTANGNGTWVVRRYLGGQKYATEKLGLADDQRAANDDDVLSFAQAQRAADAWATRQRRADRGLDVEAKALTVRVAVDAYVADLRARGGSWRDAEGRLAKHLPGDLLDAPLTTLTAGRLTAWKTTLVRRDPEDPEVERRSKDSANRLCAYLRAALNLAADHHAETVPSTRAWGAGLRSFRNVGEPRRMILTDAEVRRVLAAIDDPAFRLLAAAAAGTGARLGELVALEVADADLERRRLYVRSAAKGRQGEGRRARRTVAIGDDLVRLLHPVVVDRPADAPLFVRADGRRWGRSEQQRPMAAAVAAAGLRQPFVFYGFRHSFIANALRRGVPVRVVGAHCGTSVRMIEVNYSAFITDVAEELARTGAMALDEPPATEDPRVVPLTRRRGEG